MTGRELTVDRFMTSDDLIVLEETDSLDRADLEMKWADVRHIPVVDRERCVVGIVSASDVLRHFYRHGKDRIPIESIMIRDVLTVRPQTLASEAVALMIERKIGGLPVVGDDGKLVGIVTETDFLEVAYRALRSATAR